MKATALVTGGTGGLGTAVTKALLAQGWRVVVPWIEESELDRLDAAENLELVRADLFDPDDAARCAELAASKHSAPFRAVANLVGGFAVGQKVHQTPVEEFERLLRLNLRPTYLVSQAALPRLLEAGGGSIVCVSSQAALRPFPGASGYVTSKAAVLALVDALDAEYASDGVRVNAVLPTMIDTPGNRAAQPDADPSGWTPPEKIAEVIAFLCGDASGVVSGAHIPV
ncbi:SDR family NAD(P)-dependent oxidoreductase [Saccharomonospora marina]|uniref:SDR family NAD(P)-dependent oxidoreductase n=1 Tax=Saccharomonospora marina TaxID=632569 RepID=UPI0002E2FB00|nr:SDR family NAD(P)-dependent oxidoreductase [Saccharomonospora marina]